MGQRQGPGRDSGIVLVATQVVDVSLNISFDSLYSDPAPLDALLQRFGRINRFREAPISTKVGFCDRSGRRLRFTIPRPPEEVRRNGLA